MNTARWVLIAATAALLAAAYSEAPAKGRRADGLLID